MKKTEGRWQVMTVLPAKVFAALQEESDSHTCNSIANEAGDLSDESNDDDWTETFQQQYRNMVPVQTVALEANRYGVSTKAAVAINIATLVDYSIISFKDQINVVDHHKVWRLDNS